MKKFLFGVLSAVAVFGLFQIPYRSVELYTGWVQGHVYYLQEFDGRKYLVCDSEWYVLAEGVELPRTNSGEYRVHYRNMLLPRSRVAVKIEKVSP